MLCAGGNGTHIQHAESSSCSIGRHTVRYPLHTLVPVIRSIKKVDVSPERVNLPGKLAGISSPHLRIPRPCLILRSFSIRCAIAGINQFRPLVYAVRPYLHIKAVAIPSKLTDTVRVVCNRIISNWRMELVKSINLIRCTCTSFY